jgi:hypothetical protein
MMAKRKNKNTDSGIKDESRESISKKGEFYDAVYKNFLKMI